MYGGDNRDVQLRPRRHSVQALSAAAFHPSIATLEAPQGLPAVLIGALIGPRPESRGELHPLRIFDPAGRARRAFDITRGCLGRRSATHGNRYHRAFEFDGSPYKGHHVAWVDLTGGLLPVAIDVHLATRDRLGGQGARFEQAHAKEPAVDARSSSPFFRAIFGHAREYN